MTKEELQNVRQIMQVETMPYDYKSSCLRLFVAFTHSFAQPPDSTCAISLTLSLSFAFALQCVQVIFVGLMIYSSHMNFIIK